MAKTITRTYSSYARQAVSLLGMLVRVRRKERKMTVQELADRAGISRDLLSRLEKGDPRCELGVAFEVAAIVGVPLFEGDVSGLKSRQQQVAEKLALLPKTVHKSKKEVRDDF